LVVSLSRFSAFYLGENIQSNLALLYVNKDRLVDLLHKFDNAIQVLLDACYSVLHVIFRRYLIV